MSILDRFSKKKTVAQLQKKSAVSVKGGSASGGKVEKSETKVVAEKSVATPARPAQVGGIAHRIIVGPLVTEKSAILQSSNNQYAFVVAKNATKNAIKKALKELYEVDAKAVRVINMQGRQVRFGKGLGRRQDFKKAMVQLPKGQSIIMHEGV